MREEVMTSADPAKLKAESLYERAQVGEGHIADRPAPDASQKLSLVHALSSDKETGVGTRQLYR